MTLLLLPERAGQSLAVQRQSPGRDQISELAAERALGGVARVASARDVERPLRRSPASVTAQTQGLRCVPHRRRAGNLPGGVRGPVDRGSVGAVVAVVRAGAGV